MTHVSCWAPTITALYNERFLVVLSCFFCCCCYFCFCLRTHNNPKQSRPPAPKVCVPSSTRFGGDRAGGGWSQELGGAWIWGRGPAGCGAGRISPRLRSPASAAEPLAAGGCLPLGQLRPAALAAPEPAHRRSEQEARRPSTEERTGGKGRRCEWLEWSGILPLAKRRLRRLL